MLYICIDSTVIYCLLTLSRVRRVSPGKRQESSWNISGSSQVMLLSVAFQGHGEGVGLCTADTHIRTSSAFAVIVCRNTFHLDLLIDSLLLFFY